MKNKQVLLTIVLLCLILSGCSKAQNTENGNKGDNNKAVTEELRFSVRNGIMFGTNKEQVKNIENNNGNEVVNEFDSAVDEHSSFLWFKPNSVAGITGGMIYYSFYDDKLSEIQYSWGSSWSKNGKKNAFEPDTKEQKQIEKEIIDNFNTLNEELSKKYKMIGYMENNNSIKYIDIGGLDLSIIKSDSGDNTIFGFGEYIANDGDNYVVIQIQCYRYNGYIIGIPRELTTISYSFDVVYKPVSKEEYDGLINKALDIEQQRNTDL